MKYLIIFTFITSFFSQCSHPEQPITLLQQEPYKSLTDSLSDNEKNASLYYKRGALLLQNNQLEAAESDLKKAWSLQPSEENALGVTAILRRKSADSAILFLEEATKKLPQSVALKIGLARGYVVANNNNKALEITSEIIEVYPNSIDALLLKAEILKDQKKNSEALKTLETAYAYAPFDAELAHQLAFEYAQAKNAKAIALADSLINKDSAARHAEPYYFKGVYYANTGHLTEAVDYFNEAIQHDYYFIDAYMDKGTLLFNSQKYELALQTFKLATVVSPTFADAYFWMGKTKEALGKIEEAKADYERAYSLDHDLSEAKVAADKLANKK